jgi:phenylalanyl-tRNA synthetase alpha chain
VTTPADPVRAIDEGLAHLGTSFRDAFAAAATEQALRFEHAKVLGKKGELTAVLALMRNVPAGDRPAVGAKVNAFKEEVESAFAARLTRIGRAAREAELSARPFDLTLPGRLELGRGHAHPISQTRDDLLGIFRDLGFVVADGPEVELEENNFTKLAFPPDHPATDMQDSFWVSILGGLVDVPEDTKPPSDGGPVPYQPLRVLLRTHTSNIQVREMSTHRPPLAIVSPGVVYRRDDDVTHSPMFHQIEGFLVDEHVSMAELKGVLTAFVQRLYGPGTPVRFRPSYFPFVEPGAELDCGCVNCLRPDGSRPGCRVCKQSGWVELLGCGMIHPEVFRQCGIDSERYTGFAFGMGIDRVAMLRYGIPNIRLMFENDPRFLTQF